MNTVQYPDELPASGQRTLSGREAAQRARAMACVRDPHSTTCQGQVWVSLFFDGTGNNRDWQEPGKSATQLQRNGHSNVARLFDAHPNEPANGLFRFYIPGVGTPFEDIGDSGGMRGSGMGLRGADRINWGILQIFNAVNRTLVGTPLIERDQLKTITSNMSSAISALGFEGPYRRMILNNWEQKLASVVQSQQKKVTQINLALFGFSRGAATARACANWLAQICESEDGGVRVGGIPLRTYFMGIFDTVASVGVADALPGFDGHMSWADANMQINPMVEQAVHFVALHEQRAAFPLENAHTGRQVAYPGMHSDVGGGYDPGEQGKGMPGSGKLSQVPLIDMHHAAIRGGVPLMTMEQIGAIGRLRGHFAVPSDVKNAFNGFLGSHGVPKGLKLDAATRRHTEQYIRWRGLRAATLSAQPFLERAPSNDKTDLLEANQGMRTQAAELQARQAANATEAGRQRESIRDAVRTFSPITRTFVPDGREPLGRVETQLLEAFHGPLNLSPALVNLFDNFVHDSRAGFRIAGRHEPASITGGYFRYRRVFDH